jgi:large subunit ribosomal protein L9
VEVILIDDVEGVGKKGATVKVAPGFARNFLVPRKLAIPTGSKAANIFKSLANQREIAHDKAKKVAEADAARYAGVTLETTARAGEDGTLFGSITSSDLAGLLEAKGLPTDRRKIEIGEPIKTLGEHVVHLKLHPGVEVAIPVRVVTA